MTLDGDCLTAGTSRKRIEESECCDACVRKCPELPCALFCRMSLLEEIAEEVVIAIQDRS
jgi:hypothetical protein